MRKLRTAEIFGSGMVLQQGKTLVIWGTSDEDTVVQIEFADRTGMCKSINGEWRIELPAVAAGGPYEMVISGCDEQIIYEDVLVGEVWFAGGQSNMELELKDSEEGKTVAGLSDNSDIRYINVPKTNPRLQDNEDDSNKMVWSKAIGEAAGVMSATAYYFACRLYEELGVPIGIIDCYLGGTSALAWVSEEYVKSDEYTGKCLQEYNKQIENKTNEQYLNELEEYNNEYLAWQDRVDKLKKNNPEIGWVEINQTAGLCPWPQPAGPTSPYRPCINFYTMVKRVAPYRIRGFIYYQGEEDWCHSAVYSRFNNLVIKQWRESFEDEKLPFIITQLPMYIAYGEEDDANWAVLREQQEKVCYDNTDTYMAVLIDYGEFDNIHPIDKKTPGTRLALQALGRVYKKIDRYDNMRISMIRPEEQNLILSFYNIYDGISVKKITVRGIETDGSDAIKGFEVAGKDGVYMPAEAYIDNNRIVVFNNDIYQPQDVRYGWKNFEEANVCNSIGLPLVPFRTDKHRR
ncbi:MAG: sialate O-acetylesterase [Coprococcus sp.]